ncbi:DUF1289 domain-containing protein [Rubellimicrobium aerolatum]|uniref:DUF1289 domain-containing protein n=1 Tax=Rubellimicrobium aerolatum TaxID=490979 RepID=A0ABW0SBF1_9RHOB|nr:DUF1289 domain-containing protein [Rubellimicrobium aerolatum]MBP1805570.1 putative Fe-S protein YdhL (DUF1289 family) [Rubellimicrobium aerolatum]
MTDDVWSREEPQSPCRKVCVIHPDSGLCVGCLRTRDEIADWSLMTPDARESLMLELPGRAKRLVRRRGGHAARVEA